MATLRFDYWRDCDNIAFVALENSDHWVLVGLRVHFIDDYRSILNTL